MVLKGLKKLELLKTLIRMVNKMVSHFKYPESQFIRQFAKDNFVVYESQGKKNKRKTVITVRWVHNLRVVMTSYGIKRKYKDHIILAKNYILVVSSILCDDYLAELFRHHVDYIDDALKLKELGKTSTRKKVIGKELTEARITDNDRIDYKYMRGTNNE